MPKLTIASGDDWSAIYVDGKLFTEGHTIHPEDILDALGVSADFLEVDYEWLEGIDSFPEQLSEVKYA